MIRYLVHSAKMVAVVLTLILVPACAKYSAQPLKPLNTEMSTKGKGSVAFSSRVFSAKDCKEFLGRNVLAKGYQPVQITIQNNSKHYFNFSRSNISVPCISAGDIAKKVHTSTVARAAGYGVGALFVWPLVIPSIVDGVGSSEANQKLDEDFSRKELCSQTIAPFSAVNGLIFVPVKDFKNDFSLTLVKAESNKKLTLGANNSVQKV
jgi:hypothetical protein